MSGLDDRGISLAEVAQGIATALRAGDTIQAQEFIAAGIGLFGPDQLLAEVTEQAKRLEFDALREAEEHLRRTEIEPRRHPGGDY